jgi:hypothetical protein
VEIEKDQLASLELYRLETGTSRLISSRKTITSPSRLKMVLLPRVCPLKLKWISVRRLRVHFGLCVLTLCLQTVLLLDCLMDLHSVWNCGLLHWWHLCGELWDSGGVWNPPSTRFETDGCTQSACTVCKMWISPSMTVYSWACAVTITSTFGVLLRSRFLWPICSRTDSDATWCCYGLVLWCSLSKSVKETEISVCSWCFYGLVLWC